MQAQHECPQRGGEPAAVRNSPGPEEPRSTRRRIDEFIELLRLNRFPSRATDEALSFLHLLLTHPRPPGGLEPIKRSIAAAIAGRSVSKRRAKRLRNAATLVVMSLGRSARSLVIELLLHEQALQWDDTPAERVRLIRLYLAAANIQPVSLDAAVPALDVVDDARAASIDRGFALSSVQGHSTAICGRALLELATGKPPFSGWSPDDLDSGILGVRLNYGSFLTGLDDQRISQAALHQDFLQCGQPLWNKLRAALDRRPAGRKQRKPDEWHEMAQARVLLTIQKPPANLRPASISSEEFAEPTEPRTPTLIVCRTPIVPSSDRQDRDEIERHLVLQRPLPLPVMPSRLQLQSSQDRLTAEFPWAEDVLEQIYGELIGRAALGVSVLCMPPTLLVGQPGSGKSRLAHRIAQELGVPRLELPLGGASDTKVLGGTSRGWASGKPSDLVTLMATRKCASAVVLLDELDKAVDSARQRGGIQSYLLALLEPETAARHTDVFLKTECDFSGVMWIATANRLSPIPAPLVSRMRVLLLRRPHAQHYPVIAESVLAELAERWGVNREALPTLAELQLPLGGSTSARQVRVATEVAVTGWARSLQRH
jgi:hypothetical protein